jgi:16S rRNA (guanine527-N7)-methyltransferase
MALAQLGAGWLPLLERTLSGLTPGLPPHDRFLDLGAQLLDLTVGWNAKMDLTAAKSAEELVDLTFADATALFSRGHLVAGETWLDVGSGAGAPGLPLALLEPGLGVTLVEPMQKRVAFLRTAVGTLGSRVKVLRGRGEDLVERSTSVAISRATLAPPEWLSVGARLATKEVWVLLAREAAPTLEGWAAHADFSFTWPLTGRERRLVGYRPAAG